MGKDIQEEAETGIAAAHVMNNTESSSEDIQAALQALSDIRAYWADDFADGEES